MSTQWTQAACRAADIDSESFFPLSYAAGNPQVQAAKAVCRSCPIRSACLAYALRRGEPEGIWGGLTPRERRDIRDKTRQEATR
ncbi:WhiB family transcriptional regulator [Streptosporangium sp. DT93]|uniref:WhiB family transcriptional regulator n=1 Tax=Streptosporangium sp. DT93 TaxID=3393428 RepID=UPI003CF9BF7F